MMLIEKLKAWWSGLTSSNDAIPLTKSWYGEFLREEEIVEDMLKTIRSDPVALKRWIDPASWSFPFYTDEKTPDHAGCLVFVGMMMRNYYGLWHKENPFVYLNPPPNADGIIDHPMFPDNISGRIISCVKAELAK
jgi:hypothetical protein